MIARRRDVASTCFRKSGLPGTSSILLIFGSIFVCVGCNQSSKELQPGESPMTIEVISTAFQQGMSIPKEYTGDGADQSPPLRWSEPPSGTKSIALVCDDPDAPRGTWVHWVLFNLPTETRELEEGVPTTATLPSGAKQGKNDFGNVGYGGPAPPKGKAHRYTSSGTVNKQRSNLTLSVSGIQAGNAEQSQVRLWDAATSKLLNGWSGTTENFVRIGHSLFALLAGWFGGQLSRRLCRTSREPGTTTAVEA